MSLFQFRMHVIPTSFAQDADVSRVQLSQDEIEAFTAETRFVGNEADALIERFNSILPKGDGWSEDMLFWGDLEHDDIQAWMTSDGFHDIQIRLYVPGLALVLIDKLCALGRDYDWVFATAEGFIVQPHRESMLRAIRNSKAAAFLADPEGFLRSASEEYAAGRKPWWHFWGDGPKLKG